MIAQVLAVRPDAFEAYLQRLRAAVKRADAAARIQRQQVQRSLTEG
jgi:hypothetical protein